MDLLSLLLKYFPLVAMSVFAVSFFSGPYEESGPVELLSPAGQNHNLEFSSGGEPEPLPGGVEVAAFPRVLPSLRVGTKAGESHASEFESQYQYLYLPSSFLSFFLFLNLKGL